MTAFTLKLLVTPLLMLFISLAARRWGTRVGGLLSGLPITSALVMLFLGLEQGTAFASMAVPGALAGIAAIQATYLFYFLITRRVSVLFGCIGALAFYGIAAVVIGSLGAPLFSIGVALVLVAVIVWVTASGAETGAACYVPMPRWIIPMRMLTATLLLLAITAGADWLGPGASGLLAPIPIVAWPLAVFTHVQGGRHELAAIVRGNSIGAIGVIGFYLALDSLILQWGIALTIGAAVVLAVLVTTVLASLLKKV